jgi:hypothetical protein
MTIDKAAELAAAGDWPSRRHNARERKLIETVESFTPAVAGDWSPAPASQDDAIDQLADRVAASEVADSFADGLNRVQVAVVTINYDDLSDGVAVEFGDAIPDNAIILDGMVDVLTTFAGDGDDSSSISIGVGAAGDIVADVAINSATDWDAGLHAVIPLGTAATAVKLAAAAKIQATLTIAATDTALTAGSMKVFLRYVVSG